ncbi:MAG: hypothetical protein FWG82_04125 [Oscillospiraceae bacterium]|nr:hypothetical protein [Oscillospiraceae bacterium]
MARCCGLSFVTRLLFDLCNVVTQLAGDVNGVEPPVVNPVINTVFLVILGWHIAIIPSGRRVVIAGYFWCLARSLQGYSFF